LYRIFNSWKIAIVRALFDVCAATTRGVGRLILFKGQSIAYDPRIRNTEGIFFGLVLDPVGGVRRPTPLYFHISQFFRLHILVAYFHGFAIFFCVFERCFSFAVNFSF
jgi:hypothetical protein